MSNSPMVDYVYISPNRYSPRTRKIDTITIHCVVGQCSVETLGMIFANPATAASSNYGVGYDGRIGMYVEEKDGSWCSSSYSNDMRAVTIEVASDTTHPYAVRDEAYNALIKLVADICKRNGIKELRWKADPTLIGQVDKQNMTVHRWFENKACPGDFLYNRMGDIAFKVNELIREHPKPGDNMESTPVNDLGIHYRAHSQTYGWLPAVHDGMIAGAFGKRLEAFKITPPDGVELNVKVHIQSIGWKTYKGIKKGTSSGTGSSQTDPIIGTVGEGKRIECFEIDVIRNDTGKTLFYDAYVDKKWLGKCEAEYAIGSTGMGKQIDAIKIWFA